MPIRSYSGNAKSTALAEAITATATTFLVNDGTGYPDGAAGPFVVTLSGGTAGEEKVLCATRTGTSFTVAAGGRGFDDTTASAHPNQALVQHTFSATDAREANAHANGAGSPHAAVAVAFTPVGALASTDVQAALSELDAEKLAAADAVATYLTKTDAAATYELKQREEGFRAARTVVQALAAATFTKVVFDLEQRDDGADYDPATGTWTAPAAGWYDVATAVLFAALAAGERAIVSIAVGGVETARLADATAGAAADATRAGSVPMFLAAGDAVTVLAFRGNAGDIEPGGRLTFFTAKRRY
jgi:hypothetical protein